MSGSLLGLDAIEPIQFDVLHLKFAVIKSEWNNEITNKLLEYNKTGPDTASCTGTLLVYGFITFHNENITTIY